MFTSFLFERLTHYRQFYSTEAEFVKHLMSGEVKVSIPDLIQFQSDYENTKHQHQKDHVLLPSRYKHSDKVLFVFGGIAIEALIHAVHFTVSKVKYDLDLMSEDGDSTRIYNVDSAYVADFIPKKIIEP